LQLHKLQGFLVAFDSLGFDQLMISNDKL